MKIEDWIGRTETRADTVTAGPIAALSATLDRDDPAPQTGDPLPLLWHWLFFLSHTRQSALADDGHARLGEFLPPVPLPRRMYAGGRVTVQQPLRVGDRVTRVSRIADVVEKQGRAGPLVFVKIRHEVSNHSGLMLIEDHDIVYRGQPRDAEVIAPRAAEAHDLGDAERATWRRAVHPDPVLLFRYSALTFNGYRIHYDRTYATGTQGYPGLVVHAPLIATLLADLLRSQLPAVSVRDFSFRALGPLFDTEPFVIAGRPEDGEKTIRLWASQPGGARAFEATAVCD